MKPLFFPFTYLRKKDAETLLTCFNSFSFFTTSFKKELNRDTPDLFKDPRVDPVFMEKDELQPVIETLKEYKKWAMLNDGNIDSLKTLFRKKPYFTSDTGVANIRSEIGKRSKDQSLSKQDKTFLKDQDYLNSLLFLRLAHENDAEKEAIELKFQSVAEEEKELFLTVRGTGEVKDSCQAVEKQNYDPGLVMTEKRLCAWVDVLLEKRKYFDFKEPLLLVTTSRGVDDYFDSMLKENNGLSKLEKLVCIKEHRSCGKKSDGQYAGCQAEITAILKRVMSGRQFTSEDMKNIDKRNFFDVDLSLYRFSGADIRNLFCFFQIKNSTDDKYLKDDLLKNFCKDVFVFFIDITAMRQS